MTPTRPPYFCDLVRIAARSQHFAQRITASVGLGAAILLFAPPAHAADKLVIFPDPIMLGILLAIFVLLIFPANVLVFRPLFRVLDDREEQIEGTRRRAAQLQVDADEILGRYRAAVSEVRREAERDRRSQLDEARAEQALVAAEARSQAEHDLQQSRGELATALVEARTSLRASAQELARSAAERILGRSIS